MTWLAAVLGIPTDSRLLVGLGDDEPDGSMRVYVGARYTGIHTHVSDPESKAQVRGSWGRGGHVYVDVPTDALCDCPEPGTPDA